MFDFAIKEEFTDRRTNLITSQTYMLGEIIHSQYNLTSRLWVLDQLVQEVWFRHGIPHNLNAPAIRRWYRSGKEFGQIKNEQWLMDGKPHRVGGPAFQEYRKDGSVDSAIWYVYGCDLSYTKFRDWAKQVGITNLNNMQPEELTLFKLTFCNSDS